jgi:hypothetical protein
MQLNVYLVCSLWAMHCISIAVSFAQVAPCGLLSIVSSFTLMATPFVAFVGHAPLSPLLCIKADFMRFRTLELLP